MLAGIDENTPDAVLIDNYVNHLRSQNPDSQWPTIVRNNLKRVLKEIGSLQHATPRDLQVFLDALAVKTSGATSNRSRTSLSGFFTYLRKMGIHARNYKPLEDISLKRERANEEGIIIWEKKEVKSLLVTADKRPDGVAVWIAILAGLRRSEIARLKWTDVAESFIIVQKSKTGMKRQVPLSKVLDKRLRAVKKRFGKVVPWTDAITMGRRSKENCRTISCHLRQPGSVKEIARHERR